MPSLMASISLDASQFNAAAARVTERTKAMGAQMGKVGFSKAAQEAAMSAEKFAGMKGALIQAGMSPAAAAAAMRAQDLAAGNDKAARSTSALGTAMKGMAAWMSFDFIRGQAAAVMEWGGQVSDIASRLGISTTAVQEWSYALKQNGGDVEDLSRFFEQLAKNRREALEGSDKKMASFTKLGVSREMLETGRLEDIGVQIGKAFETGDPQQFLAELRDVGGRAAGNMVSMFSYGFGELTMEAQNLGVVMSDSTIQALDVLGDRLDQLKLQFQTTIAPVFVSIGELAMNAVNAVGAMLSGWKGFLGGVADAVKENPMVLANPLLMAKEGLGGFVESYKKAVEKDVKSQEALEKSQERKKEAFKMRDVETKEEKKARLEEAQGAKKAEQDRKREEEDLMRLGQHKLSQRQAMGGFGIGGFASSGLTYGPEQVAQNTRQKMAQHLENIEKLFKQRGQKWDSSSTEVEY